jgi:hypothetical protein
MPSYQYEKIKDEFIAYARENKGAGLKVVTRFYKNYVVNNNTILSSFPSIATVYNWYHALNNGARK